MVQRLFVGIELPDPLRQALAGIGLAYPAGHWPTVRWHSPEALHVTLSFFGQAEEDTAAGIAAALQGLPDPGVELSIQGVGYFGSEQKPTVLWAGVRPTVALMQLQQAVEQRLLPLGLQPDQRPYRPHVTLARLKRGGDELQAFLDRHARLVLPTFIVEHVCLYVSRGGSAGVHYEVIERFSLLKR